MNIFLKLKHWQLFGLFLCTYLAFEMAGTTTVISSQGTIKQISEHKFFVFKTSTVISSQETASEVSTLIPSQKETTKGSWTKSVKVTRYSPIVILFIFVLFGWFYSVGKNLNKKLPDIVKLNLTKFKWLFFIPVACMLFFYPFAHFVLFNKVSNGIEPNIGIFAVIIPLWLFSMFCMFFCIYFNAKSLKTVELQREVTFRDYVIEFFLFWFFPIGVWFIQPKINKIFSETT
jgi:hypothetical protein